MTGMTALTQPLLAWGADSIVVLTPLLIVAWGLDRFALTRIDPRLAHFVWVIVLARLLAPPVLLPWPSAFGRIEAPIPGAWVVAGAEGPAHVPLVTLTAVWAAGALLVAASWFVGSWRAARRLSREGRAVPAAWASPLAGIIDEARLARRPSTLVDPLAVAPYVTGLVRPRLILPPRAHEWPPAAFEHAVRHELAHLRRRDLWLAAAWMAACAIYWFHPLVHLARRRAYDARELCCDAEVAALVGPGYRESLLRTAARVLAPPVAVPPQHGWHPIVQRLRALEHLPARRSRRATLAGALVLVLLAIATLPPHVRLSAARPPAVDLAGLIDPATRLAMGRGSLHVRYALMQRINAREAAR